MNPIAPMAGGGKSSIRGLLKTIRAASDVAQQVQQPIQMAKGAVDKPLKDAGKDMFTR
ncbi:MAG: hypothetical protein FWE47_02110 [Oscillospiraceae bacterium]|nr:hypothetical protein [Oscillospiraceae bacterium]